MRHLLIDADVLLYKACTAAETAIEWEPGYWTWHADLKQASEAFESEVQFLMDSLDAKYVTLALTDTVNFRKAILPTYKGNRTGKRPLTLKAMRQRLVDTDPRIRMKPGLEGDDVLGILATMAHGPAAKRGRIIVSVDKDFKTVPGLFCQDGKTITEITEQEADYWHMMQTLTGDATDGYAGCPGVGKVKAERILSAAHTAADQWRAVVSTFEKFGFGEAEALVQARVARILRASDYDFEKKQPILWSPK